MGTVNLLLIREQHKECTPGQLFIDGQYFCLTLEDPDRGLTAEDGSAKVYGETAIPKGTYQIKLFRREGHPDSWGIWLQDVPHFTEILLHPGNDVKDSLGCVLVGYNRPTYTTLANSRPAFYDLLEILVPRWLAGAKIQIEIT